MLVETSKSFPSLDNHTPAPISLLLLGFCCNQWLQLEINFILARCTSPPSILFQVGKPPDALTQINLNILSLNHHC